ncbi:MAG TPA: endolytic transglycosylase MltG [Candidatus Saccharimonadales bacterium]
MRYTTRPVRRRWPRRLILVGVVLIALVLGGTLLVRHVYFSDLRPVSSSDTAVKPITVERGATLDEIAKQLNDAGLIRSPWAFKLYVGSKNVRDALQAGTYSFSPSQSVEEIVVQLTHGKVTTDLVTIIPGQRLEQIRATLANYGFDEADIEAAMDPALYAGNPALVDKPAGVSLEGYIYPDSYQKDGNTKPQQIIEKALAEMNSKLTPDLRRAFAAQGLSAYQAIILASVVEKEVSKPEDRARVAQVFLKRIRSDIALQSDATKHYFDSYKNRGLPETPISNVTISSLQAVANPASTDWLYFVSGDDGTTHFSHTLDEHEVNIAKYCTKLCGR